jgi:hypothetical protein
MAARMVLEFALAHSTGIGRGVGEIQVLRGRPPLSPLLEKERHAGDQALIAYPARPIGMHGPRSGAALTADDHPVDAAQIERPKILEQRLQ